MLGALADGRLFFDPAAAGSTTSTPSGTLDDAATGAPATGVMQGSLKKVRLNNAVRSKVAAAAGSLDLLSPDRDKRLAAAEAAFHAPDPKALPAVDAALGREADPAAKAALLQLRAATVATSGAGSEADRLAPSRRSRRAATATR